MSSSYLAVGYDCNHKCICCPLTTYNKLQKSFSYEEIAERLALIKDDKQQNKFITLSGGEPMLHPQFFDIVELAIEKGFSITVLSNASLCKDKEFVKRLKACIPNGKLNVVTAIHSSYPEIHDSMTGTRGSLLESLAGLDHLVEAEIPVSIKHIFCRKSIEKLLDTFRYLSQHFPNHVSFLFCTMDYSGMAQKHMEELFLTTREIQPYIEAVLDNLEKDGQALKRRIRILESPLCMTDPYYWKYYEKPGQKLDGYIAPNNQSVKIAFNVKSQCGNNYIPCKKCSVRDFCAGTWESAYQYGGKKLLQPVQAL